MDADMGPIPPPPVLEMDMLSDGEEDASMAPRECLLAFGEVALNDETMSSKSNLPPLARPVGGASTGACPCPLPEPKLDLPSPPPPAPPPPPAAAMEFACVGGGDDTDEILRLAAPPEKFARLGLPCPPPDMT